ncbi:MAG TPA: alcohol dehydrogenase catalytic domain-containing protein [Luteimonas sp.]|nr:alcohol dehydrogenase catalytic domain-containing protein [Luteimonas sp.]
MSTHASDIIQSRAAIADGAGNFTIDVIEVDPPGPGEVRVAIAAAGVCHTDHASLRWPGPLVMGHEGAGFVESVGEGVHGLRPGQPVLLNWAIPCGECFQCGHGAPSLCERTHGPDTTHAGSSRAHAGGTRWRGQAIERAFHLGTFADYALVRAEALTPLPDRLPPDPACLLGCAVMTGVGSVFNVARVAPGESVAVLGCGGVGLNVVQGARLAGAATIIAIDRVAARLGRARELGATHLLQPREDDNAHAELIADVLALTDGRGVDHAFEATGVPALAFLPLRLARNGGNALQVSGAHGAGSVELTDFFWNKRYLAPLYGGCVPARDFPRLFGWVETGELQLASLVSHRYPLEGLAQAFADMLAGHSAKGVLRIAPIAATLPVGAAEAATGISAAAPPAAPAATHAAPLPLPPPLSGGGLGWGPGSSPRNAGAHAPPSQPSPASGGRGQAQSAAIRRLLPPLLLGRTSHAASVTDDPSATRAWRSPFDKERMPTT